MEIMQPWMKNIGDRGGAGRESLPLSGYIILPTPSKDPNIAQEDQSHAAPDPLHPLFSRNSAGLAPVDPYLVDLDFSGRLSRNQRSFDHRTRTCGIRNPWK